MAGSVEGGRKAAIRNKEKYGKDFYREIGRKGGAAGKGPGYKGGFAGDRKLAERAGAIGGRISKRRKKA